MLGLHWGNFMFYRNLKKFPRGSLEPFGALPTFLGGARGLPGSALLLPEASRGGFGAFLKMLKNNCFYLFWTMGRTRGRQGGTGRALGRPGGTGKGRRELDRVIGGVLGTFQALNPAFRRGPQGAPRAPRALFRLTDIDLLRKRAGPS